jgi:hypothetical protein
MKASIDIRDSGPACLSNPLEFVEQPDHPMSLPPLYARRIR